jgi:hypothetical protein
MVVVENAAEALSAQDRAAHGCGVVRRGDELVAERLMRPLSVIVREIFTDDLPQMAITQRNDAG